MFAVIFVSTPFILTENVFVLDLLLYFSYVHDENTVYQPILHIINFKKKENPEHRVLDFFG
jgi:hypothetical protein